MKNHSFNVLSNLNADKKTYYLIKQKKPEGLKVGETYYTSVTA